MKLRTELEPAPADWSLDHTTPLLSLGSCFAGRIGERLSNHKFSILVNPIGVIYHPLPLLRLLRMCLEGGEKEFEESLFEEDGQWKSLLLHSQFSGDSIPEMLELWGGIRENVLGSLKDEGVLLLTLGTAYGFRHLKRDCVVANCHRQPAREFVQELTTLDQLQSAFSETIDLLRNQFSALKIILTVSPVRHIRTGMVENSVSKAVLRMLAHEIAQNDAFTHYFPAFELMVDDLRDYRFYGSDLIHPGNLAEEYIWNHFGACFFSEDTLQLNGEVEGILRDLNHRPRNPESKDHRIFLKQLQAKIARCSERLDLQQEMVLVSDLLKKDYF